MMSTKERIHTEIDRIPEEDLDELYEMIRRFIAAKRQTERQTGALSRLKSIQIEAPEDFATNLDLYLCGEKHLAADPDAG